MKKITILLLTILMIGCSEAPDSNEKQLVIKNVQVLEVTNEIHEDYEVYNGQIRKDGSVLFAAIQSDIDYILDTAAFEIIYDSSSYDAQLMRVSETVNYSSQTIDVLLLPEKMDFISGDSVVVKLPVNQLMGSKIPLGAIRSDGENYVFIAQDGLAKKVMVEVVGIFNQEVIVTGLPKDSNLIVTGLMRLQSGDPIEIVEVAND